MASRRGFCLHKISSLYQFMNEFQRLHEFLILRKILCEEAKNLITDKIFLESGVRQNSQLDRVKNGGWIWKNFLCLNN